MSYVAALGDMLRVWQQLFLLFMSINLNIKKNSLFAFNVVKVRHIFVFGNFKLIMRMTFVETSIHNYYKLVVKSTN